MSKLLISFKRILNIGKTRCLPDAFVLLYFITCTYFVKKINREMNGFILILNHIIKYENYKKTWQVRDGLTYEGFPIALLTIIL